MSKFALDEFLGTNGANLNARNGEIGANWSKVSGSAGNFLIQGNRIYCSSSPAFYTASGVPASADYEVRGEFHCLSVAASKDLEIRGRVTAADTFYTLVLETTGAGATNWKLLKVVAGAVTTLGTYAQTLSAGNLYQAVLRMIGSTITVLVDGVAIITVTDTAITGAGGVGVRQFGAVTTTTGFHLERFECVEALLVMQRGLPHRGIARGVWRA